jgi:hypothetical protein
MVIPCIDLKEEIEQDIKMTEPDTIEIITMTEEINTGEEVVAEIDMIIAVKETIIGTEINMIEEEIIQRAIKRVAIEIISDE